MLRRLAIAALVVAPGAIVGSGHLRAGAVALGVAAVLSAVVVFRR